jgi:cation:H+ antiporter
MLISGLLLIVGLVLLSKGADWLVNGASAIAMRLGVSPLFIGLTIVAFGTSLPEFFVNVISAVRGSTGVAMGNVVGSNLANILLILGLMAVINPPKLGHSTVWKEIPFSLLGTLALFVLVNDQLIDGIPVLALTRGDGLILMLFMAIFLHYLVSLALKDREGKGKEMEDHVEEDARLPAGKAVLISVVGVLLLYFGGDWTVRGAMSIARALGMSDYLIAATIVALGTSLPELVTSVKAALRNHTDIAVGNIIGSNIFNIFWVLGITAVIMPIQLPVGLNVDLGVLITASVLLFFFLFVGKKHEFKRWQGWMFLAGYAGYITFLILRG